MKKLDSIIHQSICIFEQDNLFFLREPQRAASAGALAAALTRGTEEEASSADTARAPSAREASSP